MQEYRAQLDSDRAARLSQGTNHRGQAPKVKEGGVKKQKDAKRHKDKHKDKKKKGKSAKSRSKSRQQPHSDTDSGSGQGKAEAEAEGPVRLSDFFRT